MKRFDSEMHMSRSSNDPALYLIDFDCGYPCFEMLESVRPEKLMLGYVVFEVHEQLTGTFPAFSLLRIKFCEDGQIASLLRVVPVYLSLRPVPS